MIDEEENNIEHEENNDGGSNANTASIDQVL